MISYYLQLAAVLAMILFLATGCSTTLSEPYDFSAMRVLEEEGRILSGLANNPTVTFLGTKKQDDSDRSFALYYAGQVAVAERDYEKADRLFAEASALSKKVINVMSQEVLDAYTPERNAF